MKAEIVSLRPGGSHNENIEAATARIIQGASWKRQRIVVLIPSANTIPAKVALSHWNIIWPPNNAVFRLLCLGLEVGDAYSQGVEFVLGHPELSQWEYIMTLEHDNVPPPDGALKLIESMDAHPELCAVSGLYWTKGVGGVPQIWGDPRDPVLNFRPQPVRLNELQECCGIGMGFALWRISMFKDEKLRKPWFKTQAGAEGVGTQDLYAWSDFRKYGYRCAVDNRVLTGHYSLEDDFVW